MKKISYKLVLLVIAINLLLAYFFLSPSNGEFLSINSVQTDYKSSILWESYLASLRADTSFQRISKRFDYCDQVKLYQSTHIPLLDSAGLPLRFERKIFSDYMPGNLVRKAIDSTSTPIFKNHNLLTHSSQDLEYLPYNINMFVHKTPTWHQYFKIDEEFLCPGQRYNHIPGHESMIYKDLSAYHAKKFGEKYRIRKHCFNEWTFMPTTINLSDMDECESFLTELKETSDIHWILKKARNSHNGEGITLLDAKGVSDLKQKYLTGNLCGDKSDIYIVQQYIGNPLTIYNRKFDFRVYMLIANVEPMITLYHDGFLRVSLSEYQQNSTISNSHITNTHLAKEVLATRNLTESEKAEAMKDQMWTFEQFGDYMKKQGLVQGDWIKEYVRPVMKKKMLELSLIHQNNLLKHPGVFELFGCDFMFDDDLNLWLLEVNRSPAMEATSEAKGKLQEGMIRDILDIEYALLFGADLEEVVKNTNFEFVFDDRKEGRMKYFNIIEDSCLP